MMCQTINRRRIYYSEPTGEVIKITDEWGNETGEVKEVFSEPRTLEANISQTAGAEMVGVFGSNSSYSRYITLSVHSKQLTERTRIWFKREPNEEASNYNYVVDKVADSVNTTVLGLREVL